MIRTTPISGLDDFVGFGRGVFKSASAYYLEWLDFASNCRLFFGRSLTGLHTSLICSQMTNRKKLRIDVPTRAVECSGTMAAGSLMQPGTSSLAGRYDPCLKMMVIMSMMVR